MLPGVSPASNTGTVESLVSRMDRRILRFPWISPGPSEIGWLCPFLRGIFRSGNPPSSFHVPFVPDVEDHGY